MRENVLFGPAGEVEQCAMGKEVEASLRQRDAIFALQPLVELLLERVQIANVACGIFLLRITELGRTPVAGLLLLRDLLAQQFLDQILQTVPVGISPDQARGGAGAI